MAGAALRASNPKDIIGITKPPLNLVPPVGILHEAMAFGDGAVKYGQFNWRDHSVLASIYYAAALRHLFQYWDREDVDHKSKVKHLGHAKACLSIILDAEANGSLVDDRPPAAGAASAVIEQLTRKS